MNNQINHCFKSIMVLGVTQMKKEFIITGRMVARVMEP
ncbi:hypothetical protein SAG0076_02600 [Streptococcus agalactiae CCUG 47293]|uniref:Uncharacterized protein n=1 Tax=Streptococcus agalactiae CCUG 29376 TaxID=1105255 RepID=A0AAV3JML0_STRAG|nr:hypothetical protein SAG0067_05075 [Streptococcus agalactiae CCUG 39096 A]EPT81308.1 hypothetical protein SAG0094_02930 [Streptococcus agalactiae BSU450]EPT88727.1 hypothetical protein SAG0104_00365 [Streptococcus agalactiae BSU178]EPU08633.1 hypothetical protein SAG0125_07595 [Streptococcus agalactiae STIR-CD-21]EPU09700.1 hypothetical protein SAG0127_01855 [Streptococcus agalactiae STIR-CD-23]EPU09896.1 hypothetical protein SAG0126_02860 [Streptococcus agalactiae STIR-CD-22]EPU14794.1 hy